MNKRIEEIRERCEAATPGPWKTVQGIYAERVYSLTHQDAAGDDFNVAATDIKQDAEFIAHAREDIPLLLSQLEEKEREIERLQKEVAALAIESVERDKALAKSEAEVQHWADAEKQGRLVVLPCKVGDTVYVIKPNNNAFRAYPEVIPLEFDALNWMSKNFGKTVFLTREEAEQALKEAQSHE